MHQLQTLEFRGDLIEYIQDGGQRWLPLRRFCDALGIDAEAQRRRLADRERLPWATSSVMEAVGADGRAREVFCIDLDTLFGWLFTIDTSRLEDPEARAKVVRFQCEVPGVLRRHFFGEPAVPAGHEAPGTERRITAHLAGLLSSLGEALTWAPPRYADGLIKAAAAAMKARPVQLGGGGGGIPGRSRKGHHDPEKLAEVIRLQAAGFCHREIAEQVGVGQATVSRWLAGVPAWTRNGAAGQGGEGGGQ